MYLGGKDVIDAGICRAHSDLIIDLRNEELSSVKDRASSVSLLTVTEYSFSGASHASKQTAPSRPSSNTAYSVRPLSQLPQRPSPEALGAYLPIASKKISQEAIGNVCSRASVLHELLLGTVRVSTYLAVLLRKLLDSSIKYRVTISLVSLAFV